MLTARALAGDFSVSLLAARVAWMRSKLHLSRNQQQKYRDGAQPLHLRPRELICLAARYDNSFLVAS